MMRLFQKKITTVEIFKRTKRIYQNKNLSLMEKPLQNQSAMQRPNFICVDGLDQLRDTEWSRDYLISF